MPSLTPKERMDEVTWDATKSGLMSGLMGLIPSSAVVYAAMKNPKFVKATNNQSRTALVIMPPMFMFALTSESKLNHRMREVATETEHSLGVVDWAEKHMDQQKEMKKNIKETSTTTSQVLPAAAPVHDISREHQLTELYRQSVSNSGVRIVSGTSLGIHHQFANFWQENPFKILAGIGIPTVGYIFYGRGDNLQFQSKLMHTRVFGQFAVLGMLLTLMGFKEHMDKNGKFITQEEADSRVASMQAVRDDLLKRLENDKRRTEYQQNIMTKLHEDATAEKETIATTEKEIGQSHLEVVDQVAV